jgi:hypothetical protein
LYCWCTDNSLTQSLVGSIAFADCRSYCTYEGGVILNVHQGCRILIQEGPPFVFLVGVLPVCMRCIFPMYAILAHVFGPNLKKQCPDDRSRTSFVLVAHMRLVVALAIEVPGAGGTSQSTTGIEMFGAGPRLGGGAENLLQDLVAHRASAVISGNVALAPGSSSAMGPELSRPYLPGSPSSSSTLINWRRVEDEAEFKCSHVATAEWLLHEALTLVHHNILHLVRISLRKEKKFCPYSNDFLHAYLSSLCFMPATFISR